MTSEARTPSLQVHPTTSDPLPIHISATAPSPTTSSPPSSIASSRSSASSQRNSHHLSRPSIGSRKESGTMIISREASQSSMVIDPEIDEDDVRSMSPRRSSEEVDRLGEAARRDMIEQARVLQMSLQAIVDRVETVKSEHEKLEGGNKFLQSYIGELMQTSKITSTSMGKKGNKGRGSK